MYLRSRGIDVASFYAFSSDFGIVPTFSACSLQRVFYLQNRPCIPKIVETFYMQGYKVKEKTAIVPHSAALHPQFQNSVGTLFLVCFVFHFNTHDRSLLECFYVYFLSAILIRTLSNSLPLNINNTKSLP